MAITESLLKDVSKELLKLSSIYLPNEVVGLLKECLKKETTTTAQAQIKAILKNIETAAKNRVGLCQDTGLPIFFIQFGLGTTLEGDPQKALWDAVEEATLDVPLRQNCIHPLTYKNSGTNTGWGIPVIHWEIVPEKAYLEITAVPKGFGSEIRSSQAWILTSDRVEEAAVKAVLDVVEDSLGEPCPPVIIGLGIGGTSDLSMHNAKKALFRTPICAPHPDESVAALEEKILTSVNDTEIGPMGFGGHTYAMGVNIELAGSHTAVVPISVAFQCWAARYSTARIYDNGQVDYITHSKDKE